MTDQSVTGDQQGGGRVSREQRLQTLRGLYRKGGPGKRLAAGLHDHCERQIPPDTDPDSALEEMVQWYLALREMARQGELPPDFALADVTSRFLETARSRGIEPEQFYSRVIEGVTLERSSSESPQGPRRSTRNKILDAALDVFYGKGFHLATVDEIAERAGVGKGTLYRYFSNKEKLFNELVQVRLQELEKRATEVLNGDDDVLTMITKYLRIYFEFFDRNNRLYRLIVQERMIVGSAVEDLYFRRVMRRIPVLKRKIHLASQQGVLKEIDFNTVFYGVMGFMHGVIQKWLARECSYSLVEELPGVVEVLFYGFVNTSKVENCQKLWEVNSK